VSDRTFRESVRNGPVKLDGDTEITRCFDCSQSGKCEVQKRSPHPATEIADECKLESKAFSAEDPSTLLRTGSDDADNIERR